MKIAVNTRLLIKNKLDGIGRFTLEILKRLTKRHPEIEFHFIFDRPFSNEFIFSPNIIPHIIPPPTRHPLLWYIWSEIQLPRLINKKINPDIFFSPDGFLSTKLTTPTVSVIHDINFEHRPKDLAWAHSLYYRYYFKKYAQLSTHIITVSQFSKDDIIQKYNITPNKISVVYNGVSNCFKPIQESKKVETQQKYTNSKEFFLFIGSLHKRKNIKNLLLAFDIYRANSGKNKLVIIGRKKWWDSDTENVYKNMIFKNDVIFLGQKDDDEMASILASAKALCFVSIFEGFGLPIVEAMKSNVPVITSNTSSMPEIASNAGLLVNPHNYNEIANAMDKIDNNDKIRTDLIQLGKKRSEIFNWELTTDKISKILHQINT